MNSGTDSRQPEAAGEPDDSATPEDAAATEDEAKRKFREALERKRSRETATAAGAGAQLQAWPWPVHATLAFLTVLINLWAFGVEYRNVTANADVILQVLAEVDRRRAAEGLPSNAAALAEEEAIANGRATE